MNYYIQGNKEKADQIKTAFGKYVSTQEMAEYDFSQEEYLFYTGQEERGTFVYAAWSDSVIAEIIKTHPDYKELELPVEPKFKVGDWLVYENGNTFAGVSKSVQVKSVKDYRYIFTQNTTGSFRFIDMNCRLWTIQDAKDGDVLATDNIICIFRKLDKDGYYIISPCVYTEKDGLEIISYENDTIGSCGFKPATKEDRELLFRKMKEAGYQWDEKKKELRKIIKPNFKVGDKIEATIYGKNRRVTIRGVDKTNRCYLGTHAECIGFSEQDQWHLALKPHYDIANFKPFDKVLVRDADDGKWRCNWFSHYSGDGGVYRFVTTKCGYAQCIPFEGNEALLGTTDMCPEEYVNW